MNSDARFLKACRKQAVDATPVWFMRQAGRYMAEYRAVRERHGILEICQTPELAAEVTITAAEKLSVDAAIIFADLLLPLEPMGLSLRFAEGEGPVIDNPIRDAKAVDRLRVDRAAELGYVADSIRLVSRHFGDRVPVIGFAGAPFTLASYMIEGGGSRHYIHTKSLMYGSPKVWSSLMEKICTVLDPYLMAQIEAGAGAIQLFDSWVGALSLDDYQRYVLPYAARLIQRVEQRRVPVIYFGTGAAALLPAMHEAGASVLGVDWRIPLDQAWQSVGYRPAVQGNLDPVALFAPRDELRQRVLDILARAAWRAGHIFNLGHGILPGTPVDNVRAVVDWVHEYSAARPAREENQHE